MMDPKDEIREGDPLEKLGRHGESPRKKGGNSRRGEKKGLRGTSVDEQGKLATRRGSIGRDKGKRRI